MSILLESAITAYFADAARPGWLWAQPRFVVMGGSRAYGMTTESSDYDLRGFVVPPVRVWLTHRPAYEQTEWSGPHVDTKLEAVVYGVKKFFHLCADANPNIIEQLWTDPADYVDVSPLGEWVVQERDIFLSTKVAYTFSGYAKAQVKRIDTHRKWLLDPPTRAPTRAEFGLPESTLIPADQLRELNSNVEGRIKSWEPDLDGIDPARRMSIEENLRRILTEVFEAAGGADMLVARKFGASDELIECLRRERQYAAAQRHWSQYQSWVKTRNADRAALEAKFGFDTKHGSHVVRLARMGVEILRDGVCYTKRPDAEELLAIRRGAWSYDDLKRFSDGIDPAIDEARRASKLPRAPDHDRIEQLLIDVFDASTGYGWISGYAGDE